VLPPGANGRANAAELAAFQATGARPRHNDDQLRMYADLVYEAPGLVADRLPEFFKDASFGVRPGDVERRYSPRDDVTIVRDAGFGVPHVYGRTRDGAMFGLGYAAAEDRLFLMDVLRHAGRGQLSSFAGGAEGNRRQDREQWSVAPYTEADLQRQVDQFDDLYGADGAQIQRDAGSYVAGVNAYIAEARLDPLKMPGEYAAFGRPLGPEPWKETDVIATAALVGGIFGKGGGSELADAVLLQRMRARLGDERGTRLFYDLASFEDPEAPTTVRDRVFEYDVRPAVPQGLAMPDPGSVEQEPVVTAGSGGGGGGTGVLGLPSAFPGAMSNALVVSGAESRSGRPVAVFGPQTGYFAPQLRWSRTCTRRRARPGRGSTRAARRSPAPTCTSSSAAGATTRGARRRRARTSSTRTRSSCASRTVPRPANGPTTIGSAARACRWRSCGARTAGSRAPAIRRRRAARRW
jgi:hypothetical protein